MQELQYEPQGLETPASGLPTLADALRLLRRRARAIAGVSLLAAAIGFGTGLLLKPVYEASATVEIDTRRTNISNIQDVVSQLDPDSPTIDSQIEIIQSARIAGRVVDQLQLANDPEFQTGPGWRTTIRDKIKRLLGGSDLFGDAAALSAGSVQLEEVDLLAVQVLREHISASRVGGSFLIEITVRSVSAEKATAIANALAEAYIDEQIEAKSAQAQQATRWLDKQAAELKQKVVEAERLVEAYKIENGLQTTEGHPLDERELTRAAEQLILTRAETAGALARYEQVESLAASSEGQETVASVLENDTVTALKGELSRVTRRVAELSARYGPLHPAMVQAKAELGDARHQLSIEIQKLIANLRNEYEVAKGRQISLEESLEQQKSIANASSEAGVKLRELMRDAEAARGVYESLLKRAAETRQQESLQVADARVVNQAMQPFAPVSPKKLKLALIGFAAGFVLSFLLSAGLELIWPTFVRPQGIEARMKLRHLASVPALHARGAPRHAEPLGNIRSIVVSPHTSFAEAVRAVRIAVDNERRDAAEVVVIASALPGEGKSVIASNLAHLYALSGVKTLLVDADLRQGTLTRQLLPEADAGLLDCLQSGMAARQAIVSDQATGLHFLPAASGAPSRMSAPELLSSRRMADIFSELRGEFEVIILDAPPVMPVVDARILAEHADQVVLVSRWQRSPAALVCRAGELLALSGAAMTGIVINDVAADALPSETGYVIGGYGYSGRLRPAA